MDLENKFNIGSEYEILKKKIRQTSKILETLVQTQGNAIKLHYSHWTMYLCLVRVTDPSGVCYSVRWAKYRYSVKNGRRSWYKGWAVGKVPPSAVKLMSQEGKEKYRELDKQASEVCELRKGLTSKKKRVWATFHNMKQIEYPRLQELTERFQDTQEAAPEADVEETELEAEAQELGPTEGFRDEEPEEGGAEPEADLGMQDEGAAEQEVNIEDLDLSRLGL